VRGRKRAGEALAGGQAKKARMEVPTSSGKGHGKKKAGKAGKPGQAGISKSGQ